jgi:hypothetical protein
VITLHPSVRERLRLLAPFFDQGRDVVPLLAADTLFWIVDLYATSESYPLAMRLPLGGQLRSYVQHAAVAIVHAGTGKVRLVPDSTLDPVAMTWLRRFPGLVVPAGALPRALSERLPPPVDLLELQAAAFARFGSRSEGSEERRLAMLADTGTIVDPFPPPIALGGTRLAYALPLLDTEERVAGLIVVEGGAQPRTLWFPLATPGEGWGVVRERLRAALPAANGPDRRRGPVRAAPLRGRRIAWAQPAYEWRAAVNPTLLGVAVDTGGSPFAVPSLAALGRADGVRSTPPETSVDRGFREHVRSLYDAMRGAAGRGDWTTFGQRLDSLGRLLEPRRP